MTAVAEPQGALSDAHRQMLEIESGLTAGTIARRGYRTVTGDGGVQELLSLGFNAAQARCAERGDVLLVPLYDIAGNVISHQIRPDSPRKSKERLLKYETPAGGVNRLDVPPGGREALATTTEPIWITEGAKTADAIAQTGAPTLMLAGVWGFMGRTALGHGTAVITDLMTLPLAGKMVYLAYDSDVVTKQGVQDAEQALANQLNNRGAAVRVVRIPGTPDGGKQGADDYLAAGGTLEALIATAGDAEVDPLGGKSPQEFAYLIAQRGQEIGVDPAGSFLLRPLDAEGLVSGPGRRRSVDEMRALIHARMCTVVPSVSLAVATHAERRLFGERLADRVTLAPERLVVTPDASWLDMGTDCGHDVVTLTAQGWGYSRWFQVPHWVVRGHDGATLPVPAEPQDRQWAPLWKLLGLDEDVAALVRTWLVAVLTADRVPLLWWRGAHGSGKSTLARLVGRLVGMPPLAAAPRDLQEAVTRLTGSPWLMVENLGNLEPATSDRWCTALTDGHIAYRPLHTDRQVWVAGRWTGQVTSITDVAGALDDLMSRALIVDVSAPPELVAPEDLDAAFNRVAPAVLGALLDDAVAVRAAIADGTFLRRGTYRFPALTGIAALLDAKTGSNTHSLALGEHANAGVDDRAETDPWVQWVATEVVAQGGRWTPTAEEVFEAQRAHRKTVTGWFTDEEAWAKTPRQVSAWLAAKAGRLRAHGVAWKRLARQNQRRPHLLELIHRGQVTVVTVAAEDQIDRHQHNPSSAPINDGSDGSDGVSLELTRGPESTSKGILKHANSGYIEKWAEQPSPSPFDLEKGDRGRSGTAAEAVTVESATVTHRVDRHQGVAPCTPTDAAAGLADLITTTQTVTVDVETSGYPVGHVDHQLRTVQLGGPEVAWVFDVRTPDAEVRQIIRATLALAPMLHAHSATADLVPLAHAGFIDDIEEAWGRMHDTVIPAKLADPQSTGSDPGLKQLAGAVLGAVATAPAADVARAALFKANKWVTNTRATTAIERSGWAQVDPADETMLRYAASDVLDTAALALALPAPTPVVYERERLAQRMTARVTHRGVCIDVGRVRELIATHTAARDEAAARAIAVAQGEHLPVPFENPASAVQVATTAEHLGAQLPRTPADNPSVAESVLAELRGEDGPLGAFVGAVLDFRHNAKALNGFLEPYRLLCERGDGRARPTVYTLGTDTGRMSCVRPNLQQLPREGGVRACIIADPGHVFIDADFSGVELRVAAALSQDPTLLQFIAEGRDLHREVARQVWGQDATKAHRYTAKRIVFGRLYGGGIPTLAAQANVTHDVAEAAVATLDRLTPGLAAWSVGIREAVKHGATQFPTYSGRVIHLPREYPHKGPNYCIQGTARELLVDALVRWRDTRWGNATLLPVHDELVIQVPAEDADTALAELVACMESELYGVKIVAEASEPCSFWQDSV